jgi:hypothetical protein
MTVEDGNEVLVAGAGAPGSLLPADLIADFAPGAETLDLTGLLDSLLGGPADQTGAVLTVEAATAEPVQVEPVADDGAVEFAALFGIGHTITILFDEH